MPQICVSGDFRALCLLVCLSLSISLSLSLSSSSLLVISTAWCQIWSPRYLVASPTVWYVTLSLPYVPESSSQPWRLSTSPGHTHAHNTRQWAAPRHRQNKQKPYHIPTPHKYFVWTFGPNVIEMLVKPSCVDIHSMSPTDPLQRDRWSSPNGEESQIYPVSQPGSIMLMKQILDHNSHPSDNVFIGLALMDWIDTICSSEHPQCRVA